MIALSLEIPAWIDISPQLKLVNHDNYIPFLGSQGGSD
jgi:hypothetical protein